MGQNPISMLFQRVYSGQEPPPLSGRMSTMTSPTEHPSASAEAGIDPTQAIPPEPAATLMRSSAHVVNVSVIIAEVIIGITYMGFALALVLRVVSLSVNYPPTQDINTILQPTLSALTTLGSTSLYVLGAVILGQGVVSRFFPGLKLTPNEGG